MKNKPKKEKIKEELNKKGFIYYKKFQSDEKKCFAVDIEDAYKAIDKAEKKGFTEGLKWSFDHKDKEEFKLLKAKAFGEGYIKGVEEGRERMLEDIFLSEQAPDYIPADAVEEDDEEAMLEWVLEHEDYTAEEIIEVTYPDDYDEK